MVEGSRRPRQWPRPCRQRSRSRAIEHALPLLVDQAFDADGASAVDFRDDVALDALHDLDSVAGLLRDVEAITTGRSRTLTKACRRS